MLKKLALSMLVITLMLGLGLSVYAKWDKANEGSPEDLIRNMYFTNENEGWAIGAGGTLFTTTNGGAKWDKVFLDEVKDVDVYTDLWHVTFTDDKNGWICGDLLRGSAIVLHTADGGKTWARQNTGASVGLYSIFFIDDKNGCAVGGNETLLMTNNGGSKWTIIKGGSAAPNIESSNPALMDVQFVTPQKGWIVGATGLITATTDGGKTWVPQKSNTENNLFAVNFVNENVGWAVGESGIIVKTTDGGKTWTQIHAVSPSGGSKKDRSESWLYDVNFISELDGFIVGEFSTIFHTIDGGKTWTMSSIINQKGLDNIELRAVSFPKPNVAFAGGAFGMILKYTK